jgi:hypothetical protein
MTPANLDERRDDRIALRKRLHSLAIANAALAERNRIIAELRALPLKKLRAIAKAARSAFSRSDPDHHQPTP